MVAQTLCPSRKPKGSSHKGLNWGTEQATDVSIPDLKNRITAAVETITPDMLSRVWQELDYRLDVCRVTSKICRYVS